MKRLCLILAVSAAIASAVTPCWKADKLIVMKKDGIDEVFGDRPRLLYQCVADDTKYIELIIATDLSLMVMSSYANVKVSQEHSFTIVRRLSSKTTAKFVARYDDIGVMIYNNLDTLDMSIEQYYKAMRGVYDFRDKLPKD